MQVLPELASVLEAGTRTLLYFGERDLSCNFLGGQALLRTLPWRGAEGWNGAARYAWRVPRAALAAGRPPPFGSPLSGETKTDATVAGIAKSFLNLDFLLVWNSGHLVPFSAPAPALDMFARFVHGRGFGDLLLPPPDPAALPAGLAVVVPQPTKAAAAAVAAAGSSSAAAAAADGGPAPTVASSQPALPAWALTILSFVAGVGVSTPLAMHYAALRAKHAPAVAAAAPAAAAAAARGGYAGNGVSGYGSISAGEATGVTAPLNPIQSAELTQRRR